MKLLLATSKFCGPCHMLKRRITDEKIEVSSIDMEEDTDTFRKYSVRTVPVLLVLEDDEVIERIQGMDDIIKKIKDNA